MMRKYIGEMMKITYWGNRGQGCAVYLTLYNVILTTCIINHEQAI